MNSRFLLLFALCRVSDKREKRYICFDGDVDALWVENMNSVMDDNKLLTLANGERIRLVSHAALLFEVWRDKDTPQNYYAGLRSSNPDYLSIILHQRLRHDRAYFVLGCFLLVCPQMTTYGG